MPWRKHFAIVVFSNSHCWLSLSLSQVDLCLIPEVEFPMQGDNGVLRHIERILDKQGETRLSANLFSSLLLCSCALVAFVACIFLQISLLAVSVWVSCLCLLFASPVSSVFDFLSLCSSLSPHVVLFPDSFCFLRFGFISSFDRSE